MANMDCLSICSSCRDFDLVCPRHQILLPQWPGVKMSASCLSHISDLTMVAPGAALLGACHCRSVLGLISLVSVYLDWM